MPSQYTSTVTGTVHTSAKLDGMQQLFRFPNKTNPRPPSGGTVSSSAASRPRSAQSTYSMLSSGILVVVANPQTQTPAAPATSPHQNPRLRLPVLSSPPSSPDGGRDCDGKSNFNDGREGNGTTINGVIGVNGRPRALRREMRMNQPTNGRPITMVKPERKPEKALSVSRRRPAHPYRHRPSFGTLLQEAKLASGTEKHSLEDALVHGNVIYAKCICGVLGALTEFCIRENFAAVATLLTTYDELFRSQEPLLYEVGSVVSGSKRMVSAEDYTIAVRTLQAVKRDMGLEEAFESRDLDFLEFYFSGNLKAGIVEACRRDDYLVAKYLCLKLYRQVPAYRETDCRLLAAPEPVLAENAENEAVIEYVQKEEESETVKAMILKLHQEVCLECEYEEMVRRANAKVPLRKRCVIM